MMRVAATAAIFALASAQPDSEQTAVDTQDQEAPPARRIISDLDKQLSERQAPSSS